nr:hypothetical protein [Herbaspirillum sp. ASV7]
MSSLTLPNKEVSRPMKRDYLIWVLLLLSVVLIGGCATNFYDAQSDQLLTDFGKKSNLQLYKLEIEFQDRNDVPKFDQEFYSGLLADLSVIKFRVLGSQSSGVSGEWLDGEFNNFENLVKDLESKHRKAYADRQEIIARALKQGVDTPSYPEKADFAPANFAVTRRLINSRLQSLVLYEKTLKSSSASEAGSS